MCKNNLGCAGKQNCGCGCPSCGKKRDNKKIASKPVLIQKASFQPSGYGKKQTPQLTIHSGSGYSKKNDLPATSEKVISPMVEIIPHKEDDSNGLVVAGVGFGFLLLLAVIKDNGKEL